MSVDTAKQLVDGGPFRGRDADALAAFIADGRVQIPTADTVTELSPEQAVFATLTRILAKIRGRVENYTTNGFASVSFATVRNAWPDSKDIAGYPTCLIQGATISTLDALVATPFRRSVRDPVDKLFHDVVTDAYGLWNVGETVGEAVIVTLATSQTILRALAEAVQQVFLGDLDTRRLLVMPLPEAFLPPPFRGLLPPAEFPVAEVLYLDNSGAFREDDSARSGVWRQDIRFRWRAPVLVARARLPDLVVSVPITVGQSAVEAQLALVAPPGAPP